MDLLRQSLPEVNFTISESGITITSDYLERPRFLAFVKPGKNEHITLYHSIRKDGMTIICDRLQYATFIDFDTTPETTALKFLKI